MSSTLQQQAVHRATCLIDNRLRIFQDKSHLEKRDREEIERLAAVAASYD